ncbi:MAG TPA: hypothetical protein VGM64_12595 [Lacunisphaera sp.]
MDRLPYYHLLHLFALFVLTAHTFMAFGNPDPVNKKRTMIITGVASLLVLFSGFGMLHLLAIPFATGWVIVKFVCWLGLSSLAGVVYRRAHLRGLLSMISLLLILTAVYMVYFRPF